MVSESKITCPYCNGDGHHSFKDCMKCEGTGEFTPKSCPQVAKKEHEGIKLLLAWVGFFIFILLAVYALVFLDNYGIKDTVITVSLSSISWALIFKCCFELYRNSKKPTSERMLMFNPDSSRLANAMSMIVLVVIASPLIYFALIPIFKVLN